MKTRSLHHERKIQTYPAAAKTGEGRIGFQQGTREGRHFPFYSEIQSFFSVTRGERGQGGR